MSFTWRMFGAIFMFMSAVLGVIALMSGGMILRSNPEIFETVCAVSLCGLGVCALAVCCRSTWFMVTLQVLSVVLLGAGCGPTPVGPFLKDRKHFHVGDCIQLKESDKWDPLMRIEAVGKYSYAYSFWLEETNFSESSFSSPPHRSFRFYSDGLYEKVDCPRERP